MTEDLTRDDVLDILVGATVYGAGGGGELAEGLDLIDHAVAAGKRFRMVGLADVPEDALICTPYLLGAISDLPQNDAALIDGHTPPILAAFDRLRAYIGGPIFGAVPCELGGSNTAVPFFIAAMADAVVVDADPSGRAVPEITHSAYALADLPVGTIVTANARGETTILENVASDQRAEDLVRSLAQLSDNDIAAIDHTLPAKTLRPGLITGTLSRARKVGHLMRHAQSDLSNLPRNIASQTNGTVLFQGEVTSSEAQVKGGFTVGSIDVTGTADHTGQTLRITLKNENMAAFLDGTPVATIPEIITLLDTETGAVITNPNAQVSQNVAVLILPAPKVFLTPQGLATFGPAYAGLNTDFRSALGPPD